MITGDAGRRLEAALIYGFSEMPDIATLSLRQLQIIEDIARALGERDKIIAKLEAELRNAATTD
jgi:hypothetical protein